MSASNPTTPFDQFGLDGAFSESDSGQDVQEDASWRPLGESPFATPLQESSWTEDVQGEGLAWLDMEAEASADGLALEAEPSADWQGEGGERDLRDEPLFASEMQDEQPRRRRDPRDAIKSDIWSLAFVNSVGAGEKYGGVLVLFDLLNRTTNRAHRLAVWAASNKVSGLPVEISFRTSGYVKFKTKQPVTFADFDGRVAHLKLKDRIGKSWRTLTILQVDKFRELMRVEVDNANLTGWFTFNGPGYTSVEYGNGRPAGNPDYELQLNIPVREDIPTGFKVTQNDYGLVIRAPGDILFDFDTDWLHYEAEQRLSDIMRYINSLPTPYARIRVEGHTDSIERIPGYNLRLSKRRAQTVLSYMIRNKWAFNKDYVFDPPRGLGASKPVQPNRKPDGSDNPAGRERNRRVEIFLYKK